MANDNQSHVFAIAEAWFLICITIALFTPRVDPRDRSLFSGDLSRPFRQCLLAVTCTVTLRCFAFEDRRFSAGSGSGGVGNFYYFWVGMESVLFCFLKLCTPFLLQRYLATKINIVPGKDLQGWLYAILLLDCTAIFLTTNVAPQFWALKKAGDAVVSSPSSRICASIGGSSPIDRLVVTWLHHHSHPLLYWTFSLASSTVASSACWAPLFPMPWIRTIRPRRNCMKFGLPCDWPASLWPSSCMVFFLWPLTSSSFNYMNTGGEQQQRRRIQWLLILWRRWRGTVRRNPICPFRLWLVVGDRPHWVVVASVG